MKFLFFGMLLFLCKNTKAQVVNWNNLEWANEVNAILSEFLVCGGPIAENSPCNVFLSKAVKRIYGIDDFNIIGTNNQMTANQIAGFVENGDNWTLLGDATNQNCLNQAQGYANVGKAVIAVEYVSGAHGHVCLIIAGNLENSGNWKLNCPNSASFFLNKPAKSYVGRKLSYAFEKPQNVKIYGRNF